MPLEHVEGSKASEGNVARRHPHYNRLSAQACSNTPFLRLTLRREGPGKGGLNKGLFRLTSGSLLQLPGRGKYKNKKSHINLTIATWNVRTFLDKHDELPRRRTALVAHVHGEDSLTGGRRLHLLLERGSPEGSCHLHDGGFTVRTSLPQRIPESPIGISERLMTWWIPLTNNRYATLIKGYKPTLDADPECKELFHASLQSAINKTSSTDKAHSPLGF